MYQQQKQIASFNFSTFHTMTALQIRLAALNNARQFFAFNNGLSWSVCMKLGWAKAKCRAAILNGCQLTFKKVSTGEVTTREVKNIGSTDYEFKGSTAAVNPYQIKFWDVTANAPRSCNIETVISVN